MTSTQQADWNPERLPALDGRLALVTGGSAGLGFETALRLSRAGARTILAGRDPHRLNEAARRIRDAVSGAAPETLELDLADLGSVERAAQTVLASGRPLDLLIDNAGVMAIPQRRETKDGFELTFGTNHLGHFALTGRLLPALLRAPAARVVVLSAVASRWRRAALTDLQSERDYRPMTAYAKSKRANVAFAAELARRAAGTPLLAYAVHPGASVTGIQQHTSRVFRLITERLLRPLAFQPIEQAAWPTLYAATAPGLCSGAFLGPTERLGMFGRPGPVAPPSEAHDPAAARALWELSERLTGVAYDFSAHFGPVLGPNSPQQRHFA